MGMSVDEAIKVLEEHHMWTGEPQEIIDVKVENSAMEVAIATMRKYQIFQAKYVERLKADMVAMLTEIQLEIEELYPKARKTYRDGLTSYCEGVDDSREIIQQKINALQESEDEE